jgi:sugar transferase (PEP-CTERM/EpsH1 system associated)
MNKRILFIVPYVPNRIRVRPHNLIRYLAEAGNRITVLTLWTGAEERSSLAQIAPYAERIISARLPRWRSLWNCLKALPSNKPLQSVYCWEPELEKQLHALLLAEDENFAFDAVHVEHLRGAEYGLAVRRILERNGGAGRHIPVVWDSVDSISLLFRQAMVQSRSLASRGITRLELGRTEWYEGWLLDQFDHITVTSANDRNAFLGLLPGRNKSPHISVIPNGVDLEYFHPDEKVQRLPESLVISGKMSYHANITMVLNFVNDILPLVWQTRPDVELVIVGKDPSREVQALAADPRITVTGTVEHLPPYLQKAAIAAAPIAYGAGIQNKVLEAMACGAPVVSTPQAVSAIQAVHGKDVIVASNPPAFAEAILRLLNDPQLAARVGRAGRCYVEENHHWRKAASRLEEIYTGAGEIQDWDSR